MTKTRPSPEAVNVPGTSDLVSSSGLQRKEEWTLLSSTGES